jgi:hypothetical protein
MSDRISNQMTDLTREQKNRKIAEALTTILDSWESIDFYADEAASAMLLEKMPLVNLGRGGDFRNGKTAIHGDWSVSCIENVYVVNVDRKTAIAEAFLKWMERGKG